MTVDLIQTKTRQFAKRQRTWLHNQLDLEWLEVAPDEAPATTAGRILSKLSNTAPAVGPLAK